MQDPIVEKLITARVGLLLKAPFFGNMATRMRLVDVTDQGWCNTAATDGRYFYFDTKFIDKLTPKQTEFLFCHEVLHNVFDHLGRRNNRDPNIWNIACDYAINQILAAHPAVADLFQRANPKLFRQQQFQVQSVKAEMLDRGEVNTTFQRLAELAGNPRERIGDKPQVFTLCGQLLVISMSPFWVSQQRSRGGGRRSERTGA